MLYSSLVSTQNLVEAPFIIVTIGKYTFGHFGKKHSRENEYAVDFPNYLQSIDVVKINGAINTYNIVMDYAVTSTTNPNMLEKVFSSISSSREVIISYGDWNAPAFIYKEERALLTGLKTSVDMQSSKITYTLTCTSSSLALKAGNFNFNAKTAKPSDEIFRLLDDESYGLKNIFPGMANSTTVRLNNFIATDDQEVKLEAKQGVNIFEYITYLVNCMVNISDSSDSAIKSTRYNWAVYDDINKDLGGAYFKVVGSSINSRYNVSYNTYEIDVGYPSGSYVTSFSLNNDESWSLLYNYSKEVNLPTYNYSIADDGSLVSTYSPSITSSSEHQRTTEADRTWWTQMTQFPLTAVLQIKGLLRPAILMSYVRINCYFYGHKHVSSGLYIINKQQDKIDSAGYRTTLTLTRLSGDENYV